MAIDELMAMLRLRDGKSKELPTLVHLKTSQLLERLPRPSIFQCKSGCERQRIGTNSFLRQPERKREVGR